MSFTSTGWAGKGSRQVLNQAHLHKSQDSKVPRLLEELHHHTARAHMGMETCTEGTLHLVHHREWDQALVLVHRVAAQRSEVSSSTWKR